MRRCVVFAVAMLLAGCASVNGADGGGSEASEPDALDNAISGYAETNPCASLTGAEADVCRTEVAKELVMLADQRFYRAAKLYHSKSGFWKNLRSPEGVTKLIGAGLAAGTLYYSIGGDSTTTDADGKVVANRSLEDKRRNFSVATGFLLAFQAIFGFDEDGADPESVVNTAELARRDVRDGMLAKLHQPASQYSIHDVLRDIERYAYLGDLGVAKERS